MTTKTKTSLAEQLASAEQTASAARAEAEALRAEHQRAEAERQRAREAATEGFWDNRKRTFGELVTTTGGTEQAWQTFVTAVRDGGDTVAAWIAYRTTVRTLTAERRAIQAHFAELERRATEARIAEHDEASREGQLLPQIRGRITDGDWQLRLTAWKSAASTYIGRPLGDDEIQTALDRGHLADLLPLPPHRQTAVTTASHSEDHPASYAAAVDAVVAELEQQAVTGAQAQREADLAAHLDDQAGAEPR